MTRTRVATLVLIVAAAIVASFFILSPKAKADTDSYLEALSEAGYTGSIARWMGIGVEVCVAAQTGVPLESEAQRIVATTGQGIYRQEAYEIIGLVIYHLCPANGHLDVQV